MSAPVWKVRTAALAAALLLPAPLLAQGDVTGFAGVEARGVSYQAGLGIKSVSEVAVPFAVLWPVSGRLSFDLGGRYATATFKGSNDSIAGSKGIKDSTFTISGLTDIQVRGVYQLVPDLAVLTVSANLPTGTTKLTSGQSWTAGAIASDLQPYPVANFGSGFNVTTGLALAVPVAGWALGVAGGYRLNGDFTPFADTTNCPVSNGKAGCAYKAGGEFRVRVGADRLVGQSRLSLGFTYSSFGEDEFGSSPIFQSGKRYIGQGSWSFPIGNLGLQVYAWDLYRSPGAQPPNVTDTTVFQKRNVLAFGAAGSVQMGRDVLRPQVEYRIYTLGYPTLASGGKLLSLGLQYQLAAGARLALLPSVRFDTGSENKLDNTTRNPTSASAKFTGWSAGLMLRATM